MAEVTEQEFEGVFDRAAGEGQRLRASRKLPPGEHATGAEAALRLRRLEATKREAPEVDRLAIEAAAGDPRARERLILRMLPLVSRTARRYVGRDVERVDLLQEGIVGVLRALQRYEAERGVPFTAYAGWWVRQAMQQAVSEQSRAVRLPTHVLWDIHDLREAREQTAAEGTTDSELGRRLGWGERRLEDVVRAERPALSLDLPHAADDGAAGSLGDLLADPLSEQAYEDVLGAVTGSRLRALMTTLTEREREVLRWRFGLGTEELSLRQIGRRLGMSGERVRQIEHRALAKLRTAATESPSGG
ncbi:MAG: RNA polymerase sigma factor RpoD/SigA [Gaiellales bacterium]